MQNRRARRGSQSRALLNVSLRTSAFSAVKFHLNKTPENESTHIEYFVSLTMPLTPEVQKAIFTTIKASLIKCSPPMVITKDKAGVFELIGNKPVPYGSTKKIVPGMYFSSVVTRKDMISFYFFPLYYHENDFEKTIPTLKKFLKGKTCFNFKKQDQVETRELDAMLKKGIQAWKKSGYMK